MIKTLLNGVFIQFKGLLRNCSIYASKRIDNRFPRYKTK